MISGRCTVQKYCCEGRTCTHVSATIVSMTITRGFDFVQACAAARDHDTRRTDLRPPCYHARPSRRVRGSTSFIATRTRGGHASVGVVAARQYASRTTELPSSVRKTPTVTFAPQPTRPSCANDVESPVSSCRGSRRPETHDERGEFAREDRCERSPWSSGSA